MLARIAMGEHRDEARSRLRVLAGGAGEAQRDADLVRAFLVGDEEAFEELWRRHEGVVLSVVRRYARAPEDARDLVQRAFLRALAASRRGLATRPGEPFPFRTWVIRIAVNLAKNHARDEARWRKEPLELLGEAVHSGPTADETLLRRERERIVKRAVLELPRRQREVLSLRIDASLSFEEVAEVLNITVNNAKVCFHHAIRRLRALVGEVPPDGDEGGKGRQK